MDWGLVIAVILIVLVGGSIVAIAWWRIAAGMAPYKDEIERQRGGRGAKNRGGAETGEEEEEVVIVRPPAAEGTRRHRAEVHGDGQVGHRE